MVRCVIDKSHRLDMARWWHGEAVTSLGVSTKLLYVGPG